MPKPFDATTKHLLERHPSDWLAFAGLGPGPATLLNVDLSTVTASADHVLRVEGEEPWLAHFELQAGRDADLLRRLRLYNVLLNYRHDLPVQSVAVILRPEADGPELTGMLRQVLPGGRVYHEFRHLVVRAWEKPVEEILGGGIGTLPLAPICDVPVADLPGVIRRMDERFRAEVPVSEVAVLWSATFILMGLRHPPDLVSTLLRGVRGMKESSTYQMILQEGRAEGRAEGLAEGKAEGGVEIGRNVLMRLGSKRFGPPTPQIVTAIEALTDPERLEQLAERVLDVGTWDELMAGA